MAAFDEGKELTPAAGRHLKGCGECRAFSEAALAARAAIRHLPPAPPDADADRELIAALRAGPPHRPAAAALHRPGLLLAFAGSASFLVTLGFGAALSGTPPYGEPLQAGPAQVTPEGTAWRAAPEARLERWLESGTAMPLPSPVPAADTEPAGDPVRRSGGEGAAAAA